MSTDSLSDEDAQRLLQMPKLPVDENKTLNFPDMGQKIFIELKSHEDTELFMLCAEKSCYNLEKVTYHTRARRTVMLVRLELNPHARHMNPDGELILGPHFHQYRSSGGTKWAIRVPLEIFPDPLDRQDCWIRFLKHCNVVRFPDVRFNLFS